MSGVIQTLFGGSSSSSKSGNQAYPWAQQSFGSSSADAYNSGLGSLMDILSGDSAKSKAALDNWWNSSGGQFQLNQGLDALTSKFASQGLYKSGAAAKAMEQYRSDLASTKLNEYLQNLFGIGKLGLGGGSLVTDAGQYSKGKGSESTGNLGAFLGAFL